MLKHPPKEREVISWFYAFFWAGLTFVTVPYVGMAVNFVVDLWGIGFFTYSVVALVTLAAAYSLFLVYRRLTLWSGFWLIGVAALIIYQALVLAGGSAVEAVHYIQYGTLSLLLFRAFSHRVRDYSIYVAVTLTAAFAGMIDETIQWLTPDRFFDTRDVWLNFKAAALVQIGLALGIRPKLIFGLPGWASLRRLCLLSALTLGYLGLCLQNTPDRIAWYTPKFPGLAFVNPSRNIMVEYGHLHLNTQSVPFRSRLTLEELREASLKHAKASAPNLDDVHESDSRGDDWFSELLVRNTYLYEARIHQLRRDQNFELAIESDTKNTRELHFTAAYWGNDILKEYFGEVLIDTRYEWMPEMELKVQNGSDLTKSYASPVSRHLIITLSRPQLGLLCFSTVVFLLLAAFYCEWSFRKIAKR